MPCYHDAVTRPRVGLVMLMLAAFGAAAEAQLRVTSPYLDVVERYRSGDHARAVEEVSGFPASGIAGRARRDLLELPCQLLAGTSDCARARTQKPAEFAQVLEVWATTLPAAAALHVETALAMQTAGRIDVARDHQALALDLADRLVTGLVTVDGHAQRADLRRRISLLAMWLLQLRLEFKELEMLLVKARQMLPGDALVVLANGAFHEVQARAFVLLDASEGRQGNLAAWRHEERTWRLARAETSYREAIAADASLAEAHLRVGRVLSLQGRRTDAHVALAKVGEQTTDTRWRYLALLFRAAVYEEDGMLEPARAEYRAALETWPQSQAARLGLSRLSAHDADWASARRELDALAESGTTPESQHADPWWAYDFGQAWRIEPALAELRTAVSR